MRISATGNKARRGAAGFTLVEVLTVVLILGLVASVVVLTLPETEDPARAEAFALASRTKAAGELAITTGQLAGLSVTADSYTIKTWAREGWQLKPLPGMGTASHELPSDVSLSLMPEGEPMSGTAGGERRFMLGTEEREQAAEIPVILFSPSGEAMAFTATVTGPDRTWRVVAGPTGTVTVEAADG